MPVVGQTARGRDIGKKSADSLFIWHSCIDCGKERWVISAKGQARSNRCKSCSTKKTLTGTEYLNNQKLLLMNLLETKTW